MLFCLILLTVSLRQDFVLQNSMATGDNIAKTEWSMLVDRHAIGQGAYATVYKANHRKWGTVAYKLLSKRGEFIDDE